MRRHLDRNAISYKNCLARPYLFVARIAFRNIAVSFMSTKSRSNSTFRKASRWTAIALSLTILTWCGVIIWWQITQRVITTADALIYLIGIPILLFLCLLAARWRLTRALPIAVNDRAITALPTPPQDIGEKPDHTSILPILGAWTATNLAFSSESFIESLADKRSRPTPDPVLTDANGFPVLSGRVRDLDTASVKQDAQRLLESHLHETQPNESSHRDAFIRALTLLDMVLAQALQEWPSPPITTSRSTATHTASIALLRGTTGLKQESGNQLQLQVILLVSADFTATEQRLAQAFLSARLTPLRRTTRDMAIEVLPATNDTRALAVADNFRIATLHDEAPHYLLLLACDSLLCPAILESLELQGRLFNTQQPNGLMPGEAAFGVLLSNEAATHFDAPPICHLTPVHLASSRSSEPTTSRPPHPNLSKAVEAAIAASSVRPDQIGTAVCDTDHRASHILESIEAIMANTPQLDAIQNRLALNEACGHLGVASILGVFAAGAAQSAQAGHPVLIFSAGHDFERAAALLIPADRFDTETEPQPSNAA